MAVKATHDTLYRLQAHSTGIAAFKYRQVEVNGGILNSGDERFVGDYSIARKIRMKSRFDRYETRTTGCPAAQTAGAT